MPTAPRNSRRSAVRYAVVGLGHIAQAAVLPAFAHAAENSELTAIVSGDPEKLEKVGRRYRVRHRLGYRDFDDLLASGEIDAVYIALPNHLHRDYTVRAANAGVHVLCEKPMAVTEVECREMIAAAEQNDVRLMIAYRLHFDEANLTAVDLVQSGRLGEARLFTSTFTMQVKPGDIRLGPVERGGGPVYDIGIYCINASRYLFEAEPEEVVAMTAAGDDPRFRQSEEMASATLRFPGERLATFTCSFGAEDVSEYRVVGTKGDLMLESAYEYAADVKHRMTVNGRTRERIFPRHDQFAPELIAFSECVLNRAEPEPSGWEGLADVRIIRALYQSAREGHPVRLPPFERRSYPTRAQAIQRPAVPKPSLVKVREPG